MVTKKSNKITGKPRFSKSQLPQSGTGQRRPKNPCFFPDIHDLSIQEIEKIATAFMPWLESPNDLAGYMQITDHPIENRGATSKINLKPRSLYGKHFPVLYRLAELKENAERRDWKLLQAKLVKDQLEVVEYGEKTELRPQFVQRNARRRPFPSREERRNQILKEWRIWTGDSHPTKSTVKYHRDLFGWDLWHIDYLIHSTHKEIQSLKGKNPVYWKLILS